MAVRAVGMALALAIAGSAPGCIEPKCFGDRDCAGGKVCEPFTGACVAPQCVATSECAQGRICEQHACVVGCLRTDDCSDGMLCLDSRCRGLEQQCQCPLAPAFCADDLNPVSPTVGQPVCVPGPEPGGTMLFFGSVSCSHCQGLFTALLQIQARMIVDGLQPRLVFVQTATRPISPALIVSGLPGVSDPVVLDSDALSIWESYHVDWYYVVVVDTHACLATRFGPLEASQFQESMGPAIEEAWRKAMTPACPDIVAGQDADAGG